MEEQSCNIANGKVVSDKETDVGDSALLAFYNGNKKKLKLLYSTIYQAARYL